MKPRRRKIDAHVWRWFCWPGKRKKIGLVRNLGQLSQSPPAPRSFDVAAARPQTRKQVGFDIADGIVQRFAASHEEPTGTAVTEPTPQANVATLEIKGNASAPFVYFDYVSTFGMQAGAIVLELVARTILPDGSGTRNEIVTTCHLRCSPDAARNLHQAIEKTFKLASPPAGQQVN
jgi:hypothetical protein